MFSLISGLFVFILLSRARLARRLREAESMLAIQSALLDTLPIPVYMKDLDRRFLGCNQAFTAFTGLTCDFIKGKRAEDYGRPEIADEYRRTDENLLATGGSLRFTGKVVAADGSIKPVEFYKAVYADPSGVQSGIIGAFFDLTERVRAENEMRSMLTTRDRILAILSHDLLNPVWGMKKSLELEARPFSQASAELFADEYTKSIGRIYNLLENLLGWARLQWRDLRVEPMDFDLMAVIQEEFDIGLSASPNGYHRLRVSGPPSLMVRCDRNLAMIIMRNLVSNALKYSDAASPVNLSVEAGDGLRVCIEDTGPGIPESLVEALAKGDSILDSGSRSGHGFGLPLCRDVARLMSSELRLENIDGGGTRASFIIPRALMS